MSNILTEKTNSYLENLAAMGKVIPGIDMFNDIYIFENTKEKFTFLDTDKLNDYVAGSISDLGYITKRSDTDDEKYKECVNDIILLEKLLFNVKRCIYLFILGDEPICYYQPEGNSLEQSLFKGEKEIILKIF